MSTASYLQTNFLGGEWGKFAQGRADMEQYRTALNLCRNNLPTEQGAATRRPGTRLCLPTRSGAYGVLREFFFTEAQPYNIEITQGHMRFFRGPDIVTWPLTTRIQAASGADPSQLTVLDDISVTNPTAGLPWVTGDQIVVQVTAASAFAGVAPLLGRTLAITVTGAHTFTIADAVTGVAIDGSTIDLSTALLYAVKIVDYAAPYQQADLQALRLVQNETSALILGRGYQPQAVTSTSTDTDATLASFTVSAATFLDGPYLDEPTDGSTLTPTGTSGTITLAASSIASINGGAGFASTDVGRMVRLFSEPSLWASGTSYAAGNSVTYNGAYWTALTPSTGKQPDLNLNNWAIDTTAAAWTWGTIASVVDTSHVTVALAAADPLGVEAGGALLHNLPVRQWRLGAYSNTTGWPASGAYQGGRLWLDDPRQNYFNASKTNTQNFSFAPTSLDGTVGDANGITEAFNSKDLNTLFWMEPDHQGILCGTQGGEWLISASATADPITPDNIQANRVSKFGCENIEPRHAPLSILFVRRYARKLTELVPDTFSQRYVGRNLSERAPHLMGAGIAEIAYQVETTPILWARMGDGSLCSMTYRRDSPWGTQPPEFYGWAKHALGHGRSVISIQGGPAVGGGIDTLMLVTQDPSTTYCYVEMLTPIPQETDTILGAWYVDGGAIPAGGDPVTVLGVSYIRLYGLWSLVGKTVSVWGAGLDLSDFTVTAAGTVDIPVTSTFSLAYLAQITAGGCQPDFAHIT